MARNKKHCFVVLDGTFAINLLEEYKVPYVVDRTPRKKGIALIVDEQNVLVVRDLFTSTSIEYKELQR